MCSFIVKSMIKEGKVIESSDETPQEVRKTKIERMYGDARIPIQNEYHETKTVIRSYNFIWFIVGIIEALLGFRFVFEIAGANSVSPFVQFVYVLSYPFAQPFHSIFGVTAVANSFFDWSLIVAIVVYWLIGFGLVQILRIIHPVTTDDVRHRVRTV